jgi:hypothetical protein
MKNMIKAVLTAGIAIFCLAACGTIKPIAASSDTLAGYQNQPLTVVTYNPKNGFLQMTAGSAMFGAIGAVAAMSESERLVKKYDLVSPSIRTAEKLTPVLAERLKPSSIIPLADASDGGKKPAELAALAGNKGMVLDVQATAWTSVYFPVDWSHYKPVYFAVAHLVDGSTGKVVAQAPCKADQGEAKGAPTYDELYADNASLLKAKFQEAADNCADQMSKALLGN